MYSYIAKVKLKKKKKIEKALQPTFTLVENFCAKVFLLYKLLRVLITKSFPMKFKKFLKKIRVILNDTPCAIFNWEDFNRFLTLIVLICSEPNIFSCVANACLYNGLVVLALVIVE